MVKTVFKWNSVVSYEETYIDGKSQGIRVVSKFTTEPKEQKQKYSKKKKKTTQFTDSGEATVETR